MSDIFGVRHLLPSHSLYLLRGAPSLARLVIADDIVALLKYSLKCNHSETSYSHYRPSPVPTSRNIRKVPPHNLLCPPFDAQPQSPLLYRGANKGLHVLLSRMQAGQAEQLSKSRKKFLATTYKPLFTSLYQKCYSDGTSPFSRSRM